MRKRSHLFFLLLFMAPLLASCSPGHLGGNEIAFVRGGRLWTIDPDGSNAFQVAGSTTPVIGYAWSPDHHMFVFRLLDGTYASSVAGKHLQVNPLLGVPGDLPSSLNTVGLDGGVPIPIVQSISGKAHSNAWWNTSGSRLLYREIGADEQNESPINAAWWVSQNDQPEGLARKSLPSSFSIPSFTGDSSLAIGNSLQGLFTTTLAGANFTLLSPGALPGHPLPATLERLLWQPAHTRPALLYAALVTPTSPVTPGTSTQPVELIVRNSGGQLSTIATCPCTQFTWSPDGNFILYATRTAYSIYSIATRATYSFSAEIGSVPYWSHDSRFLLLDGAHSLSLLSLASHRLRVLLNDGTSATSAAALPGIQAFIQPAPNSLWAPDSRHFVFPARGRTLWQNQRLASGNALYVATIDDSGQVQGAPVSIDGGNDSQPGWSYEDPDTSFLF